MSSSHWECSRCISHGSAYDFCSREQLEQHRRTDRDHNVCEQCDYDFWTPNELQQVYSKFKTPNVLRRVTLTPSFQHAQVHLPQDKECFVCSRTFATFAAMIIHLENGCTVQVEDMDRLARQCYQWKKYIAEEYAHFLTHNQYSSPLATGEWDDWARGGG